MSQQALKRASPQPPSSSHGPCSPKEPWTSKGPIRLGVATRVSSILLPKCALNRANVLFGACGSGATEVLQWLNIQAVTRQGFHNRVKYPILG